MKKLIIVRHGTYRDNKLDEPGRKQMESLGQLLKERYIGTFSAKIISSTAGRAIESANILGEIIGVSVEKYELLWSEPSRHLDVAGATSLIVNMRPEADILIVVTHQEYCNELPFAFSKRIASTATDHRGELEKGDALVIHCEADLIRARNLK